MKILVVGPGGREHAIVRACLRDAAVDTVEAAPGNAGIAQDVTCHAVDANDGAAVAELATQGGFNLVVVGPEAPLAAGVADVVRAAGIPVFGPSQAAAQLEASKAFAKEIMAAADVPTAQAVHARDIRTATTALDRFGAPYVVKADGLAAGKGVVVTEDREEALDHARACLGESPDAGSVVIEEFLDGPEVSLFVLSDGENLVPLSPAQDFKRIYDGGLGPNTGGMGAYTPLDWLQGYTEVHQGTSLDFTGVVMEKVARPTVAEMARRGTPFVGVLYCGLAVTSRGVRVVEFNVRFGDPETQAVLERLTTGLGGLLLDAATDQLGTDRQLTWSDGYAVDVVIAAENYPDSPRKGDAISGIAQAERVPGVSVLHAGTAASSEGEDLVTAGGRVLAVVGLGETLELARDTSYAGVEKITWPGAQHRNDIAADAIAGTITVRSPADDVVPLGVSGSSTSAPQLPGWVLVNSGKVRELYAPAAGSAWDGRDVLLMVATDRISAYDHSLSPGIPGKGAILTQLSQWWFDQLAAEGIGNHVVSTEVPDEVAGRALVVEKLQMVQVEAIVRGYITGSALAEYREHGTVTGIALPTGLKDGDRLPEAIFTPSTKAEQGGHDENITFAQLSEQIGAGLAAEVRDAALRVYSLAERRAREAGIILADTKFEFGITHRGDLVLGDEVLTPDSSRFWDLEAWDGCGPQASFDKQFVRDWLTSAESGWDKDADQAPPELPDHIVDATRDRYVEAYRRLTGADPVL